MRKPELTDYNLAQADIERARAADLEREILQQKILPWIFLLGPVIVGYRIYSVEPKFLLAAVIGFFIGGIAAMFVSIVILGLWHLIWAQTHRHDQDVLDRYKQYQKAENEFEQYQQRLIEGFWVGLSGKAFEHELASLFRRLGYSVELTKYGRDGGVDIYLRQGTKSTIVQCKRYSAPVGVAVVRELYGVLQSIKADAAILASTGGFTQGVVDFARNKPIELLGLSRIVELQKSTGLSDETG